jgi:ethanolamine ammonia-lyase large subunit
MIDNIIGFFGVLAIKIQPCHPKDDKDNQERANALEKEGMIN